MFLIKYKNIFRNRWYALIWAAGFIGFAFELVDMIGEHKTVATEATGIEEATAALNAER